ncbi:MAG: BREX protein BrxB domain-containing protein [Chloroflexota bacterium]
MLSLKERIDLLEIHLKANPPQISSYADLPFAILRYDPQDEWTVRREVRLLATRLADAGKNVRTISMADLLWEAVDETEGMDALVGWERENGFQAAEAQLTGYLTNPNWYPLPDALLQKLSTLDPGRDVVFLVRAAAMAPDIYHMSKLLDELQGRTRVPIILFYPGTVSEAAASMNVTTTEMRFMGLEDRQALGNYRVKIYG